MPESWRTQSKNSKMRTGVIEELPAPAVPQLEHAP
jgi:hypothetical protein